MGLKVARGLHVKAPSTEFFNRERKGNMIEKLLQDLTAALNANTAALLGKAAPAAPKPADAKAPAKTEATKQDGAKTALTYDDVKGPFLQLVKKDRELALKTIAPLPSLKEAKPEQFPDLLAKINKALA